MHYTQLSCQLTRNHPAHQKLKEHFSAKCDSLKHMKLNNAGTFQQELIKVMQNSYEIALLITKEKIPHSIGKSLVKPYILHA
jgi:CMP-2-keto-3-deoxyoctulosonic acid synthetase